MKITELSGVKEIARRANVSIATVDRVLHNRTGVAEKTKAKILAIIKEMDYKPNILAKRLASKRVYRFGILVPKEEDGCGYWSAPVMGIKTALSEFGEFGVELKYFLFERDNPVSFTEQATEVLKTPIDGVILAPIFLEEARDFTSQCLDKRIQFVFVDSDLPQVTPLSYIGPDLFQSGRVVGNLCEYMLEEGDHVLVLNLAKDQDSTMHLVPRVNGFESYLREYYQSCSMEALNLFDQDPALLFGKLDLYLAKQPVKMIYVTNSRVYLVAEYLKSRGKGDVKLVGYDYLGRNIELLREGFIDFLICQKPTEQGYRSFVALYEYFISKKKVIKTQYMPIDIVTKENYQYYEY